LPIGVGFRSQIEPIMPIEPICRHESTTAGRTARELRVRHDERTARRAGGKLYQYSSRHGLRRLDLGGVAIPNSICFSPDGRTMYFCDSPHARIRQCDYDAESAHVGNVREFVRLKENSGQPDGSIVDSDGCVWNAVWGAGLVRRAIPTAVSSRRSRSRRKTDLASRSAARRHQCM
jgi:sugar lactone lactonase YvrE